MGDRSRAAKAETEAEAEAQWDARWMKAEGVLQLIRFFFAMFCGSLPLPVPHCFFLFAPFFLSALPLTSWALAASL